MHEMTRRDTGITVLLSVLATLLALAPLGYTVYRHLPASVATVDLKLLLEEEQARTANLLGKTIHDKTRSEMKKQTAEFAAKLSNSIQALEQSCNCVIMNKAALLGGSAVDYTNEVRHRLSGTYVLAQRTNKP